MAKLIPTLALISILLIIMIANASSARRTIITTVEIDETNPNPTGTEGQCREEVEKQDLNSCVQYMRQSISGESEGGGEEKQQLHQCCSRLKQVRDECQCQAIESAYQEMSGEVMRHQYPRVIRRVRSIPLSCELSEVECRIR
ncbi:2S seed storage albumin protein-like [Mercurialis annua]|uniref:2S seed storage albumin protein-like n=1 Tax=Mercurialis annua TaxID=3986 RepID=UPI00215E3CA6|nr:2S seed storage albumin protein-like [Mercurialis annua]XP_050217326.1 2S seed storage albumin protein-like [Mercurialis annua]